MILFNLIFALTIVLVLWVRDLYFGREVIREADGSPYLIRYFLWKPKNKNRGRIYLHHILRSDHDRALHCHPWGFTSFILWGGYTEIADLKHVYAADDLSNWDFPGELPISQVSRRFSPLSILRRPAEWKHRLVLPEGKTAWTLVKTTKKLRNWGFYPNGYFCPHYNYDTKTGLCNED